MVILVWRVKDRLTLSYFWNHRKVIIFLNEIYETRKLKRQELEYYKEQMNILQQRMILVKREITLTDTIIDIIEKEIKK